MGQSAGSPCALCKAVQAQPELPLHRLSSTSGSPLAKYGAIAKSDNPAGLGGFHGDPA